MIKILEKAESVLELFTLLGKSLDDHISAEEFNALLLWLGVELPADDVQRLFNALDSDGNGNIEYHEILAATK